MMEEEPALCYADDSSHCPKLTSLASINDSDHATELTMSTAMKYRDHENMSKNRIMKNLFLLSSSLFLYFFAYQSLANLQSTMNSSNGIGMQSQSVIYATSMLSCLFLPDLLTKSLGCKRTLVLAIIVSLPFLASNFDPVYYIIMPASVLVGIALGPLGACNSMYITEMVFRYRRVCPEEALEVIMARFYGLLSVFLESTQIFGNLISYYVLRPAIAPILNHTNITCGIGFVETGDQNPNLRPPAEDKRYMLVSIYVMSAVVAAVLMGLFMDKLDNDVAVTMRGSRCRTMLNRLMASARLMCNPHQILLLPITIQVGMEIAFYTGDFTQAYIACSWGVHHVGFVTICFGVCGAIMALLVGPLVKCISQMAVLCLAAIASMVTCVLLFFWQPSPDTPIVYFVFAGVWGMGDAVWWSQVTALYGLMFPNDREAAFSNLYFWSFLGFFLSYSYANYFSVAVKIIILQVFLVTGMMGYLFGQYKIRSARQHQYVVIDGDESLSS